MILSDEQKLELILHLAHCRPCREASYRRYRLRHRLRRPSVKAKMKETLDE